MLRKSQIRFPLRLQTWLRKSTTGQLERDIAAPVHLSPGGGFTFELAGESRYQDELDTICGGRCDEGHNLSATAQLCFEPDNPHDPNAVAVLIQGMVVGYVPRSLAAGLRLQLLRLNPNQRPVMCEARILGGCRRGPDDEGQYRVNLSLSAPLKVAGHARRMPYRE